MVLKKESLGNVVANHQSKIYNYQLQKGLEMFTSSYDLQEIFETYQPKILRYLGHLAGEEEAEDLAQEVFIKAIQSLPGFRVESSLSTWLYRIATNCAFDRIRSPTFRQAARNDSNGDTGDDCDAENGGIDKIALENTAPVEQQLVKKEMGKCILSYVDRLPEAYRTVLLLSDLEELSNKEIAEILELTLDSVKIRLHRARAMLREHFESTCEYYWLSELSWQAS
jgi:RNA polymerase sigma-70 factor (ECF subfamily)